MGEKELTDEQKYLDTYELRVKYFPIEGQDWSSRLTADNLENAVIADNGSTYTITLDIKDDEPSGDTVVGYGNHGKAFSLILPTLITDNAGAATKLLSDVKTGHSDGNIVAVIDKATGNLIKADYYFVCIMQLTALSKNVDYRFGLLKKFSIEW